jgi:hypothetical protein
MRGSVGNISRGTRKSAAFLLAASLLLAVPATAQRDPAYQAARSQGLIGEQPDGYLGFVVPPSPDIRRLVDTLNIRRREVYTERAVAAGSTVQQFAFVTGCNLIVQTVPGEKYQTPAPESRWMTRTAAAPVRDAACL